MSSREHLAIYSAEHCQSLWSYAQPLRALRNLSARRELLWQFTLREVQGRYRGSYLGIFWALFTPLLTLVVYTFVFSVILPGGLGAESFMERALTLFSGLIAYSVFAECTNRAPTLIIGNPNLVKKVVFPLEILPVAEVGSAVVHSLLSVAVLLIALLAARHTLPWTVVLLPLVYLPLIGFSVGVGWLLATLGVFIRDISNAIGIAVHLLFFLTPIIYRLDNVPPRPRLLMVWVNPFATIVEQFRAVVNEGRVPEIGPWLLVTAASALVALAGYMFFMKMKRALADVI